MMMRRMPRRQTLRGLFVGIFLLQPCLPAMPFNSFCERGGAGCPLWGQGIGASAPATATVVRLRGGMGRGKQSEEDSRPPQSMMEKLASMDTEQMKGLARKQGVFDDGVVEETKEMSWLDKKHQQALQVLRRRANTDKKEKQREHMEKHGADDATIARAEEVQVTWRALLPVLCPAIVLLLGRCVLTRMGLFSG